MSLVATTGEFVDLGQEGSVTGTMLIKSIDKDNRWAGMVGLALVDDSTPLRVFVFHSRPFQMQST